MGKNKFAKFMIALSGFFAAGLGVLGIKLNEDSKKINDLESALSSYGASMTDVMAAQQQIMTQRQDLLDKIANAPAPDTTKTVVTKTVVPGKVVQQKVPVQTSSKTTKTS